MMTPTDPPASDLGALTPEVWVRLGRLTLYVDDEDQADLLALFAAYDAQAARLAEWEEHQCPQYRQHHQSRLVQLRRTIAERDALAARLAAVSDALMYAISIICNVEHPTVTPDVPWEPLRRRFLDQAHAALGPPAAERAPRTEAPGAPAGEEP
jgi:phage-related baseplate assembly protein